MDLGGKLGGYSWPTCSKQLLFVDCRIVYSASEVNDLTAFPIDFASRPYNTVTLPCERVIIRRRQQARRRR